MAINNPERANRGGDVEGTTKTDAVLGKPLEVGKASFDPGYSLESTLSDAGTNFEVADLKQGYCTDGSVTGEARKKNYK